MNTNLIRYGSLAAMITIALGHPAFAADSGQRKFEVFFDFDKSDITSAAKEVIKKAADSANSGKLTQISVTGHTDTVGTAAYNQALSERRADAVKKELIVDGVPDGAIAAMGVGKTGLLVPTGDGVREPQNRRVEILGAAPAEVAEASAPAPAPAAEAPAAPAAPAMPPPEAHLSGHIEFGITANPDSPKNGLNYGHLFTDKSNQVLLNQAALTYSKDLDPMATGWDFGFKLQAFYGSDARYTHFLGEFTHVTSDRNQVDLVEANFLIHAPVLTDGGVDVKVGQFSTPIGFEVIDPTLNPFYSHSYIFNFGIPLKHTGGYLTVHVNDTLDIYAGGTTGVNTSVGSGDNNKSASFLGGIGLNNLADGKLTVVALTSAGPEFADLAIGTAADKYYRYLSDAVVTYKATDELTLTTELNWIRDEYGTGSPNKPAPADAFGVAQYAAYTLSDELTLNGRAEYYSDDHGFFVGSFKGNTDFVRIEEGVSPIGPVVGASSGRYGELTAGVTYKPAVDLPAGAGLMIRPEVRYDHDFAQKTFDVEKAGVPTKDDQVTIGLDAIITF